jgi:phage gpG-like protein
MIGVQIDGSERLINDLKMYGIKAEKAVDIAVRDTANAVKKDATKRLKGEEGSRRHYITGTLAKSIYNKVVQSMERIVGTGLEYAKYIEFGTRPHIIQPKTKPYLKFKVNGQWVTTKLVNHPGFKGESFLNWAAVNQRQKHRDRIIVELNKINR